MLRAWSNALQFFLIVFLLISANSANASAQEDFKKGVKFFETEKYLKAAQFFERAQKQGMKSTALYYNLGSTYFKLENYNKSHLYFKKLKKRPEMKSLAEYNLGLIALRQKDEIKADSYFRSVINDNRDKKLVYLASVQINKKHPDYQTTSIYGSIKLGYDDNINITPVDTVLNKADSFSEIFISADYLIKGNRKNGWISDALFYRVNYSDSNTFDQDQYGLGIKKTRQYGNFDTHFRANYEKLTYGKEDYLSIFKLEAQARYHFTHNRKIHFRYRYDDINSDIALYNYLQGWRQKYRTEFRQYNIKSIFKVYYELELNDRKDLVTTSGDEFSYSPTRHTIRLNHTRVINKRWRLNGDIAYRDSNYPATATQHRNDERWRLSTYAEYRINKSLRLRPKIEYTDNNSNDPFYDYSQTVYTVDLSFFY